MTTDPAGISKGTVGTNNRENPLLSVQELVRHFRIRRKNGIWGRKASLRAVDNISFDVDRGETFGLVGESGCGKSTTAKLVLDIEKPTSGCVIFKGREISAAAPAERRRLALRMQYVFQDPLGALDPRMRIIDQVAEPLIIHRMAFGGKSLEKAAETLLSLDLKTHVFRRYPHELSGGQRQRAVLARAMILNPELLICDEPISALDVSIQAQVLNLLSDLSRRLNLTNVFISHDMSVVRHVCNRIAVMYLGRIVELASNDELFNNPAHPYTCALLSAVPIPEPGIRRQRILLKGDPPSPVDIPPGCRFHTRCHLARPVCRNEDPIPRRMTDSHTVACHFAESGNPADEEAS